MGSKDVLGPRLGQGGIKAGINTRAVKAIVIKIRVSRRIEVYGGDREGICSRLMAGSWVGFLVWGRNSS
jgi:hypothetical protein